MPSFDNCRHHGAYGYWSVISCPLCSGTRKEVAQRLATKPYYKERYLHLLHGLEKHKREIEEDIKELKLRDGLNNT